ncbi:hypothetical protein RB595_010125 [Gaeumannomyces hyphopodioides]
MSSRGGGGGGGGGGGSHQPSILSFFRPRNQRLPATQPPPASSSSGSSVNKTAAHPLPPPPLPQHHHQPPPPTAAAPGLPARPDSAAVAAAGAAAAAVAAVSGPECRAPASWPTPHPQATVAPVAEAHVTPLRRINSLLLCVNYPDSFYARVLDPAGSGLFSRVILWSDEGEPPKVIGSLIARLEPSPFAAGEDNNNSNNSNSNSNGTQQQGRQQQRRYALYVQSLTLLSPFRSLGLAAAALDAVVAHADAVNAPGAAAAAAGWRISDLFAHVWTDNDDGLRWYAARGFARAAGEPVKGYYLKLRPDTAWVVRRPLGGVAAAIAAAAAAAAAPPPPPPPSATAELPPPLAARRPSPLSTKAPTAAAGSASGTTTPASAQALCFQERRPDMDWNDLPADVVAAAAERAAAAATAPGLLDVPAPAGDDGGAGGASHASSRSSSTARKKRKDRSYPAAAFGS